MLVGILTVLALVPSAMAQSAEGGLDAHGFVVAALDGDPRDPLYNLRAGRFEGGEFFFGGVFEYAKSPLIAVYTDAAGNPVRTEDVLDNLFALNVSGGVAVFSRLRLDVAVPLYFASTGAGETPQGFGLGDIRATATVPLFRPEAEGGGFGLAIAPHIDLPTGNEAEFLGQPGLGGGGRLTATYEFERVTVGGEVGAQFDATTELENLTNSDALLTGLSIGYLATDTLGLNLEAHLSSPFQKSVQTGTANPSEVIASVRKRMDSGGFLVGGVATALSRGESAAVFRAFLGGGFGRIKEAAKPVLDTDGDGFLDNVDGCVTEPETKNSYKDEDGCPDAIGSVKVVVTKGGKPVDGAEITLLGGESPAKQTSSATTPWVVESLPGKEWEARAFRQNCLAGTGKVTSAEGEVALTVALEPKRVAMVAYEVVDKSGKPIKNAKISWEKDADGCVPSEALTLAQGTGKEAVGQGRYQLFASAPCFATKEAWVDVPASGELPVKIVLPATKVKVEAAQIRILEKVFFEVDSDVIKAESYDLLNEVAATIKANPQVGRVEVQGHTDSDGSDAYNLDLSDRRVQSVRRYFIDRGVPGERLTAKGYGESLPIDTNKTAAGKAKNRRVEFKLLDAPATAPATTTAPDQCP